MSDFDRIFDAPYTAAELFTNRTAEHESFRRSVFYHRERVQDGTATLASVARHHVLTFYGIGGIGKTELSRRLERWVVGELPKAGEWGPGARRSIIRYGPCGLTSRAVPASTRPSLCSGYARRWRTPPGGFPRSILG